MKGLDMTLHHAARQQLSGLCALILLALLSAGCSTAPRPVSSLDRDAMKHARLGQSVWNISGVVDPRHPPKILAVLFDGTRNDRNNVPDGERPTVVADLKNILDEGGKLATPALYVPGVGTSGIWPVPLVDAAMGLSTVARAERAFTDVRKDIDDILARDPEADVRVVVIGFSRGAASARHLLNRVAETYTAPATPAAGVRQYAFLFDTVATGMGPRPMLRIPANVDHAVHIVADDERRIFFRPTLDASESSSRIETWVLPGVHSDQVGSYQDGIGLAHADEILQLICMSGLTDDDTPCFFQRHSDPTLQGMHDSRWWIERVLHIDPSKTIRDRGRRVDRIAAATMSADREAQWQARARVLEGTGRAGSSEKTEILRQVFSARRSSTGWELVPADDAYTAASLRRMGENYCLQYRLLNGSTFHVDMPAPVHARLYAATGDGTAARLELGIVVGKSLAVSWSLNGVNMGNAQIPIAGACGGDAA